MESIPTEIIQSYLHLPRELFPGCSSKLFMAIADGGNHFLDYGITEGMNLIFDQEKPHEEGQISCFIDSNNALRLLTTQESGYTHLGGLVGAISSF